MPERSESPGSPGGPVTLRGTALVRRARWLEKKLLEGPEGRPGMSYDAAEYAELMWVFESLRIPFVSADSAANGPARAPSGRKRYETRQDVLPEDSEDDGYGPGVLDDPPKIASVEKSPRRRPAPSETFVPGEPRRRMFVPGGF